MDALLDLLKRLGSLERAPRTSRGNYPAPTSPYKPLLLLTVLWRIQQGSLPHSGNTIPFGLCLEDFSELYQSLFGDTSDLATKATQAFWYLGTGKPKMWELVPQQGQEDELITLTNEKTQIKSAPKLNSLVALARFSPSDWQLLQDSDVQKALISFLIAEQFTDVRRELGRLPKRA